MRAWGGAAGRRPTLRAITGDEKRTERVSTVRVASRKDETCVV
jgi:hypothetical protein